MRLIMARATSPTIWQWLKTTLPGSTAPSLALRDLARHWSRRKGGRGGSDGCEGAVEETVLRGPSIFTFVVLNVSHGGRIRILENNRED
jgi:hypothetical protein